MRGGKEFEPIDTEAMDFVRWSALAGEGIIQELPMTFSIDRIYPIPQGMRRHLSVIREALLEIGIGQLRIAGKRIIIEESTNKSHIAVIVFVIKEPKSDFEVLRTTQSVRPMFENFSWKGALARADDQGYFGSLMVVGHEPFLILKDPVSHKGRTPTLLQEKLVQLKAIFRWATRENVENRLQGVYLLLANDLEESLRLYAPSYGFVGYRRVRGGPETHLTRIT